MPKRKSDKPARPGLEVVSREGSAALYVRGTIRGKHIFESTRTDNPRLAEEYRSTREAELYRAAIHGTKPKVSFASAALSYLQFDERTASTKHRIGRLVKHFGAKVTCDEVDQGALDRAGAALCRAGSAPATRLREVVGPVKAILQHAAERGWCDTPKFAKMKGSNARTEWFTPAEAEAMITAAPKYFKPLLTFLYTTGARVNEAVTLEWERDVDLQNCRAVFRDTKNGTDRIVDLPPRAVAVMGSLAHRKGRVFLNRSNQPYRDTNVNGADEEAVPYGGQIKAVFATTLKAAKIARHMTPHNARHSWATWHYCVHKDPMRLREDGGWKSISQVERYAKLAPPGMADDIRRVWGLASAERRPGLQVVA